MLSWLIDVERRQVPDPWDPLRPVHAIGQGYDMAEDGGRQASPSPEETWRFLDVAARGGAVGASFWVWQDMTPPEWQAFSAFSWAG